MSYSWLEHFWKIREDMQPAVSKQDPLCCFIIKKMTFICIWNQLEIWMLWTCYEIITVISREVFAFYILNTAAGESVKIRSGRPANDAVERFVDALTIKRLVLYLKEPKRKQACWSCADWPQVGYKLTSLKYFNCESKNQWKELYSYNN